MRRALVAAALTLAACEGGAPELEAEIAGVGALAPGDLPGFFDCLRENGWTAISAHRGGPAPGYAENAIATFEHTLATAPALLEVDVGATRDGALVLMHDDDVARTTNGEGAVGGMTLAAFQALRLRDETGTVLEEHPPTLAEALAWAERRAVLELDIKRSVAFEDVVAEVREANAMGRVAFITYSVGAAARLAALAPEGLIYTSVSDARELDTLARRGVDLGRIVAWLGADAPPRDLVAALADRGVEVRIGMFGRGRDYSNSARLGAQVAAVDDPREAYRDLDAADAEEGYGALRCASAR